MLLFIQVIKVSSKLNRTSATWNGRLRKYRLSSRWVLDIEMRKSHFRNLKWILYEVTQYYKEGWSMKFVIESTVTIVHIVFVGGSYQSTYVLISSLSSSSESSHSFHYDRRLHRCRHHHHLIRYQHHRRRHHTHHSSFFHHHLRCLRRRVFPQLNCRHFINESAY